MSSWNKRREEEAVGPTGWPPVKRTSEPFSWRRKWPFLCSWSQRHGNQMDGVEMTRKMSHGREQKPLILHIVRGTPTASSDQTQSPYERLKRRVTFPDVQTESSDEVCVCLFCHLSHREED